MSIGKLSLSFSEASSEFVAILPPSKPASELSVIEEFPTESVLPVSLSLLP